MKQSNPMSMPSMPSMKTGDLVRVYEPRACGGILLDSVGLVVSQEMCQEFEQPRWTILWAAPDDIFGAQKVGTYGYGIEVVSERR